MERKQKAALLVIIPFAVLIFILWQLLSDSIIWAVYILGAITILFSTMIYPYDDDNDDNFKEWLENEERKTKSNGDQTGH